MADTIDTLYANSQMLAPHITAPDTKEGLQHTVAMQRQQLDQMGRRHHGAFAAARRLVQRLTNRVARLEAKAAKTEAMLSQIRAEMEAMLSQSRADRAKTRAVLDELSEKLSQLEIKFTGLKTQAHS